MKYQMFNNVDMNIYHKIINYCIMQGRFVCVVEEAEDFTSKDADGKSMVSIFESCTRWLKETVPTPAPEVT